MPFTRKTFAYISGGFPGPSPKLWAYETTDLVSDLAEPDYWTPVRSQLTEGDVIQVNMPHFPQKALSFPWVVKDIPPSPSTDVIVDFGATNVYTGVIPDISTAQSLFIPVPSRVSIVKVSATLFDTITGTNPLIRFFNPIEPIFGTDITINTAGSQPGDTVTKFSGVDESRYIELGNVAITTDGASTGAVAVGITLIGA